MQQITGCTLVHLSKTELQILKQPAFCWLQLDASVDNAWTKYQWHIPLLKWDYWDCENQSPQAPEGRGGSAQGLPKEAAREELKNRSEDWMNDLEMWAGSGDHRDAWRQMLGDAQDMLCVRPSRVKLSSCWILNNLLVSRSHMGWHYLAHDSWLTKVSWMEDCCTESRLSLLLSGSSLHLCIFFCWVSFD